MSTENGTIIYAETGKIPKEYKDVAENAGASARVMFKAYDIYSMADKRGLIGRGEVHQHAAFAASLYFAAKDEGTPIAERAISEASGVTRRKINKAYRDVIVIGLGLKAKPMDMEKAMERLAEFAGLGRDRVKFGMKLYRKAEVGGDTEGKDPTRLAPIFLKEADRRLGGHAGTTRKALAEQRHVEPKSIGARTGALKKLKA